MAASSASSILTSSLAFLDAECDSEIFPPFSSAVRLTVGGSGANEFLMPGGGMCWPGMAVDAIFWLPELIMVRFRLGAKLKDDTLV